MSVVHTTTGNHFDWVRSLENERGEVYQGNMTGTSHHYYDRYKKHIKAGKVLVFPAMTLCAQIEPTTVKDVQAQPKVAKAPKRPTRKLEFI